MPKIKKIESPAQPVKKLAKSPRSSVAKVAKEGLEAEVFDMTGKKSGTVTLAKEVFDAKVNNILMAQAVRIFLANQRLGTSSTKTRGEVQGSTRKIYRQKGTGRARHGSLRAPIFVHGGVAFGPHPRDLTLAFPKKMKRAALFSALTSKFKNGEVTFITGVDSITPKTKAFVQSLKQLNLDSEKRNILLVISSAKGTERLVRAARNVEGITFRPASSLNTYDILNTRKIVVVKDALEVIEKTYLKGESN